MKFSRIILQVNTHRWARVSTGLSGCVHLCRVAVCDPIWQVTLRSCVVGYVQLTQYLYLFYLYGHRAC